MKKKVNERKRALRLEGGLRVMVYDVNKRKKRKAEHSKQSENFACVRIRNETY